MDHIIGHLWMSGAPDPELVCRNFNCLVLSAQEHQPEDAVFPGIEIARADINDDGSPMLFDEAKAAAYAAGRVISWLKNGKRVLVTCWAGRNRSGLVCALVLCKGFSLSPNQAIYAVRCARGHAALSNPNFVRFIHSYGGHEARGLT